MTNDIVFEYNSSKAMTMPKEHIHDTLEIYYLISGQRYYFIENRTYLILPGDFVFIGENILHKTIQSKKHGYERFLIDIDRQYIKDNILIDKNIKLFSLFDNKEYIVRLSQADQKHAYDILNEMNNINGLNISNSVKQLRYTALVIELLMYVKHCYEENKNRITVGYANERIHEILEYINEHYYEKISLETLSEFFHISKYYLCRLLKENIGMTFGDYLSHIRIKEAKELLLNTQLSVTEISIKVGYSDISYFGKVFKRIMKVSPLKYRNR